jgi:glucose/arabinose dehydrogenase
MGLRRRLAFAIALSACASAIWAGGAGAATLEPLGSFSQTTFVTSDTNDENRIYVVEQDGRIRLVANGETSTFLDIDSEVISAGEPGANGEQGLLSMAFAPDFHISGRFYVAYTGASDAGDLHVAELISSGDSADPATLRNVITVPHPGAAGNHNGGQLQFGPDGFLYVSTGDQAGSGAPAQDPNDLSGKLLRLAPSPGGGYQVPADNPFVGMAGARPEIWSLGLRNPWRFSFDRATGDLLLSDVGAGSWEEVNFSPAPVAGRGLNFGWPVCEGPYQGASPCSGPYTIPTFYYVNGGTPNCAITGGYVVRDPGLEELHGRYLYADFCVGEVRSQEPANPFATDRSEVLSVSQPTTFGEDRCGRVYVAARNGQVARIVDGTPAFCPPPDRSGPNLGVDAKRRQKVRRREVAIHALSDEQGRVDLSGVVTKGGREKEVLRLDPQAIGVGAGVPAEMELALSKREARRCLRLIGRDKRVEVQITAVASDAAGNPSAPAEAEVRLVAKRGR